jgi:hypothetical protein
MTSGRNREGDTVAGGDMRRKRRWGRRGDYIGVQDHVGGSTGVHDPAAIVGGADGSVV